LTLSIRFSNTDKMPPMPMHTQRHGFIAVLCRSIGTHTGIIPAAFADAIAFAFAP